MTARRTSRTRESLDSIGQRLARLRRARGLSQAELAKQLGVTQAFVSQFELDKTRLYGDFVAKLARILKVTADEILGLRPQRGNGGPKSRRLARRLQQIEESPERDQQAILRIIDAVLARRSLEKLAGSHARG